MALGLHVQHGRQCSGGRGAEHPLERFQHPDVSEAEEAVGGLARADRGMDRAGDESGTARLPSVPGSYRCAQPMALGHCRANGLVV